MGKYDSEPSSNTPSEDCVELRQSFPGVLSKNYKQKNNEVIQEDMEAVTTPHDEVKNNQLYWSDQECREENWFICAKAMVISKGGKCTVKMEIFFFHSSIDISTFQLYMSISLTCC